MPGPAPDGSRFNDRLTILETLGQGGMGAVYKAHDAVLDRVVALKVIRAGRGGLTTLRRFEREAKLMARLHHPACVAIHDSGVSEDGQPYLVMEYVPGESLARRLDATPQRRLDPAEVAAWARSLAEGLQACHREGGVHRDVKPANVLIDEEGQARLTDFGIAYDDRERAKLTRSGTTVGTVAYMAPEQLTGQVDPRADIYSLGATTYEALAGRPPFRGELATVLKRIMVDPPERLRAVSGELEAIVLKCLEKDPEARYASAGELAEDLGRYLRDEPVQARAPSRAWRLQRWLRRNRAVLLAGGAPVLAAVLLWASGAWGSVSEGPPREANGKTLAKSADVKTRPPTSPPQGPGAEPPGAPRQILRAYGFNLFRFLPTAPAWAPPGAKGPFGLIAGSRGPEVWDLGLGKLIRVWRTGGTATVLALSARRREFVYGRGSELARFELDHPTTPRGRTTWRYPLSAAAYLPDGRIALGDRRGVVTLCRWGPKGLVPQGDPLVVDDSLYTLAAGGPFLVTASRSASNRVRVWRIRDRALLREVRLPVRPRCLAVSPDARFFLVGTKRLSTDVGAAGSLLLRYRVEGQAPPRSFQGPGLRPFHQLAQHFGALPAHGETVTVACFGPAGKRVYSASGSGRRPQEGGALRAWEAGTGRHLWRLAFPAAVDRLAVSADGRHLLLGGRGNGIQLWRSGSR